MAIAHDTTIRIKIWLNSYDELYFTVTQCSPSVWNIQTTICKLLYKTTRKVHHYMEAWNRCWVATFPASCARIVPESDVCQNCPDVIRIGPIQVRFWAHDGMPVAWASMGAILYRLLSTYGIHKFRYHGISSRVNFIINYSRLVINTNRM